MTSVLEKMRLKSGDEHEVEMAFVTINGGGLPGGYYATIEDAEEGAREFAKNLFQMDDDDGRVELVGGKFFISGGEYIKFTDAFDVPQKYIDAYWKWVDVRSKGSFGNWEPRAKLCGEY